MSATHGRKSALMGVLGLALMLAGLAGGVESGQVAHGRVVPLSDWIFVVGALILFMAASRHLTFQSWPLTRRLGFLLPLSLLFWPGMILLERGGVPAPPVAGLTLRSLLLLATLMVGGLLLLIIKSLIYVQQSRTTAGQFRLMMALMVVRAFYRSAAGPSAVGLFRGWDEFSGAWPEIVLFVAFMLFIVINGFRCKWMHFLSRNEKIGVFFLGVALNVAANALAISAPAAGPVVSLVGASFIQDIQLIFLVYGGMALMGVLFMLPSAGLMDRRMREIHFLQGLGAMLGSVRDQQELVAKTTELARQVVGADGAWLELKQGENYALAGVDGLKPEVIEAVPPQVMAALRKSAAGHDDVLLLNDIPKERRIGGLRQAFRRTGSLLAARVCFKRRELGVLYAVSFDRFGFVEESRGLFKAYADQVAVALENLRLLQVTIDQEVFQEELRVAHDAQMRLLPQAMPHWSRGSVHAFCATANEIGGDFYDLIPVGPDRVDIIVGDVSGKGASAAFYMAELKGVVQALAPHFSCPVKILTEINGFIRKHFETDTFVTMAYAIYSPEKGTLELARAGHPPVALVRAGEVSWLEPDGLGLGLATNDRFERTINKSCVGLEPGDLVFLLTDGLIEARNPEEEELGEDRLAEMLRGLGGRKAETVVDDVRRAMEAFTSGAVQHDDVTLVALTLNEADEVNRVEGESQ